MKTVLYTGDRGFIAGYTIKELLDAGYFVVGVDNEKKYGEVKKSYDDHPNYIHRKLCVVEDELNFRDLVEKYEPDYIIANAALIGGIRYFHDYAFDLIAKNEKVNASTFGKAIPQFKYGNLKRIIVISSSMVYENCEAPYIEEDTEKYPPPSSTYGFQKLASEYFAKGAFQQYGLPYTIVRPFNCVGIGEYDAIRNAFNEKMATSHVVPDLIRKVISGMNPVPILGDGSQVRCYTYGGDIAKGILKCIESKDAENEVFNISTDEKLTVMEVLKIIWKMLGKKEKLEVEKIPPYEFDVSYRVPNVQKAYQKLGFVAKTPFEESLKEVIEWMKEEM